MCPGLAPLGGSIPPPGFGFGCCCCLRATCNRPCLSSLRNKRPDLSGRPPCKGVAILLCVRLWCYYAPYRRRSECAVRCFRCLWVWGVLVALIKLAGFLVRLRLRASPSGFAFVGLRLRRASPSGFAFWLCLRASPSGPPGATTRLITHGRCPGSFPDSPQNTHGTPRSYLQRNTTVRRFGGFPASFAVIYLQRRGHGC